MSNLIARRLMTTAAAMALWTVAATAWAQEYGQWSWDGSIGARQRTYEFAEGHETLSELDQRETLLTLALNGFLIHPAIAEFRIGIDTNVTNYAEDPELDSRRLGYRTELRVFPTGLYPIHVYAARHSYDYESESQEARIGTVPGETTTFGARVRVRGGPLAGLIARSERSRFTLLGPHGGTESHEYQLADWAGGAKGWQHHYRLEREARDFASTRYQTDDTTFLGEETYRSDIWQFASYSRLTRRGWSSETTDGSSLTAFGVQNRALRIVSRTRSWELQHSSGFTLGESTSQSHSLGGRYSLTSRGNLTIAPFASLGVQTSDRLHVVAPQAGVTATWTLTKGCFNTIVSGSAASLVLQTDGDGVSTRDSTTTAGAGASFSLRPGNGLNSQLDTFISRNDLRRSGEALSGASVLIPIGGVGTEDRTQARLTLGQTWIPFGFNLYVDWLTQKASGELQINPYSAETLSATLQMTTRNINLSVASGNATLEQTRSQELRFVTAAGRVRILRMAAFTVSHRRERRFVIGEPEIDGTRTEAGMSIRFGAFSIEPQAFLTTTQQSDGANARSNRGFTVTIGRDFGGTLPIVTGARRRGVIR